MLVVELISLDSPLDIYMESVRPVIDGFGGESDIDLLGTLLSD